MAVLGVSYSENPKNSGAFTSNNDYYSSSSSLFEVSAVEAEYYAFDTTDITPETLAALQAGDLQVSLNFTLQSSAVFSSYVDVYAFNDIETQPVIEAGGSELDMSPYDDITDPPAPDDLGGFEVKEQDGSVEVSVDVTSALAAAAATGNDLIVSFRENSGGEITDVSGVSLTGTGYQNVGLEVESEGGSTSLRTTDGKAVKPLSAYSFTYSLTDQFYASHVSAIGEPVATLEVLVSKAVNGTLSSPGYAITAEGTNASGQGVYLVEGDTDFLDNVLAHMVFTPTAHQASVGTVILTQLSMEEVDQTGSVLSDFGALSTVTVTEAATPPTFTGSAPVEGTDQAPFAPAPGLTLVEPDFDAAVSATLTLEAGTGTLSGSGLTIDSGGTYSIGATSVGELTGLLQGLTFDPTPGLVPVGDASTAQLLVTATEAGSGLTASALQTLTIDAVAAAPAITGLAGPIGGDSSTPYQVFPQIDITSTEYQPAEYAVLVLQAPEGTGSTGSDRSAEDALSGSGLLAVAGQPGAYTYVLDEASPVTPAALAAALQDIVFDPAPGLAPFGTAVQTTLDLTVFDSAGVTSTATQDLVTTYVPATPVIADFQTTASITDQQTLDPAFGTVSISLADYEPQVSATIDINALVGSLAGTGLVAQGRGDYVLAATTPADLAGELDSLVYTPIPGRTAVNQQTTTDLTLTIGYPQASGIAGHSVQGSIQAQETLTITAAPAIPVISGAADVSIEKGVTADPFAGVTIVDPTQGAIETLQISFDRGGVGVLTAPGLTSPTAGVYRLTGTVAQVNADLAAADYVDDAFPGAAGTLQVTLSDSSSVGSTVVDGADVSFDIEQPAAVACFCRGTRISTERGEVAVEELAVGDRVVTAERNLRPIRWLGHRRIDCTRHPDPAGVWPVLVRRSAFADGAPARDLWLSPCHSIAAEGALVPIRILLNGGTVRQVERPRVEYWHVELDTHDVILAEGLPAESYLDTGNRSGFTNGAVVAQGPPQHPKHWAETCLPLAFAGPLVDQIRAALLARAISLGFDITDDAGLHAVADGVRIEPVWLAADRFALMLPPEAGDISLRSRQFVPCQVEPASRDERTLGVCVGRLQIDGATVDLVDEAVCGVGWHALERYEGHVQRWTTGVAKLPARTRLAVIDLAGTGSYWADLRLSGHVLCG